MMKSHSEQPEFGMIEVAMLDADDPFSMDRLLSLIFELTACSCTKTYRCDACNGDHPVEDALRDAINHHVAATLTLNLNKGIITQSIPVGAKPS